MWTKALRFVKPMLGTGQPYQVWAIVWGATYAQWVAECEWAEVQSAPPQSVEGAVPHGAG
jgi:hypothetical protein